ncbi:MAG: DUF4954 family protein [Candidatus Omnitrophica bacterium]|nr:DUF4954 family protein [Candidatus Omnitrophota bacterium]
MKTENRTTITSVFAAVTAASFILTQVIPAWALRPQGASSPTVRQLLQAGLEEPGEAVSPVIMNPRVNAAWQSLASRAARPDTGQPASTREILWDIMTQMGVVDPELAAALPARQVLDEQLAQMILTAPGQNCLTCAAHVVANASFSSNEQTLPEPSQSAWFNQNEFLTALLITLDLLNHGRILSIPGEDGHVRLANSLLSVKEALEVLQRRLPAERHRDWTASRVSAKDLQQLLSQGATVVAHVGGNHFVHVLGIERGEVIYSEPAVDRLDGQQRKPMDEFLSWWKGRSNEGVVLIDRAAPEGREALTENQMRGIIGCCGINSVFGQYGGIRSILDAVLRLKYRAPDNTGIAVISEDGYRVVKAGKDVHGQGDGGPDTMIEYMYSHPIYPEGFPQPFTIVPGNSYQPDQGVVQAIQEFIDRGRDAWRRSRQTSNAQERVALRQQAAGFWAEARRRERDWLIRSAVHQARMQGFDLLREEGLLEFVPTPTDAQQGNWPLHDLTQTPLRDLFEGRVSVQAGRVGGVWAGDQFLIRHDELPAMVKEIGRLFDLTPEFVRIFLRAELVRSLQEARGLPAGKAQEILKVYDLLSNRALAGQIESKHQERWDEVMDYLVGRWLWIPSDYNVDTVRHTFRMQMALIGMFQVNAQWRAEVERRFEERVPGKDKDWLKYWKRERDLNTPGHAYAALVDWFHDWAHEQKVDVTTPEGAVVEVPLLANEVYEHIVQIRTQQRNTTVFSPTQPTKGTYQRGYSLGTVNEATVRLMGEVIVGHGRWAMTGDPSRWNAHPHNTQTRVVAHNGQVKGTTNSALRKEHKEAHTQPGPEAAQFKPYEAYYWEEEATPSGKARYEIVTDTRTIVVHWDYVAKQFEVDKSAGRVQADGLTVKTDVPGQLNQNRNEFNRAEAWNRVVENLRRQGRKNISVDEVAFRVALMEMQDGSELGVNASSLHNPLVNYVVSHDRPVDIVLLGDRILVTSDYAAGIALFPAPEVAQAAQTLSQMQQDLLRTLEQFRELRASGQYTEEMYVEEVKEALADYERRADPIRKKYQVDVYHLKELNKFARITRRVDEKGQARLNIDITHLDGSPLSENEVKNEARLKKETVSPELGVKGSYRTFMELHIDEIPKILLDNAVSYMTITGGQATAVNIPTIKVDNLRQRFGQNLQNLKRLFLIGVGSSWRDAKVAEQLFRQLLPGVEILVYDPVEIQNLGIKLNPETDLAIGMSWSGTTASMVKLFEGFSKEGIAMMAVTGKPGSTLAQLGSDSAGMIDVKSGPEASVATTKGFESVLYCLCLTGVQLSQVQGDPSLEQERRLFVQDLWRVVDHVHSLIVEPGKQGAQRVLDSSEDVDSLVNRVARTWKNRQKVLVIGSRNNPVYIEGELKAEEIAWLVGKAADISDESWRNLVARTGDPNVPEAERVATIFNMTDPARLDEFMRAIQEVTDAGIQVVVQTFDKDNKHLAALQQLQREGKIELVIVPRVRLTLQGLVDAPLFFRFSLALARARGLTDANIDNSRNLAKSVVVSGARSLQELVRTSAARYVTIQEQAGYVGDAGSKFNAYRRQMPRIWASLQSGRVQAIARLPVLLNAAVNRWLEPGASSILAQPADRDRAQKLLEGFIQAAKAPKPAARVVIVTDEEATQYAGEAAVGPLGSREVVVSGEHSDLYNPDKGVRVRVGGWYYRVFYDQAQSRYRIRYVPELNPFAQGQQPVDTDITIASGQASVIINGREYQVDPRSFDVDKGQLVSGLQMKASQPDLLLAGTENVKVYRSVDQGIDQMVDQGTMVVLVSRGRNRGAANVQVPPIPSALTMRSPRDLPRNPDEQPEDNMVALAQRLRDRGVPFITITDDVSRLNDPQLDPTRVTHLPLGTDVDDINLYSLTYLGLLTIGARVGELLGRDTADFQASLKTVPGMVAQLVSDQSIRRQMEDLLRVLKQYRKIHIIGGGQADGKEFARLLSMNGIFAEAQLNDSAWHGPLAAVDPNRRKYADQPSDPGYRFKYGVNGAYSLDNDTLVVFLMTDSKFSDSSITDAQVYDSRNGRFLLVTLRDNARKPGVGEPPNLVRRSIVEAGPVKISPIGEAEVNDPNLQNPEGIFSIPNAPDALGNFNVAAFAALFSEGFRDFHNQAVADGPKDPPSRFRPSGYTGPTPTPAVDVPSDFLRQRIRPEALRQLGDSGLGDLYRMYQAVVQTDQPQVRLYQDIHDPNRTAITIAVWDRRGLLGEIGDAISRQGISIDNDISDNYPEQASAGKNRVAFFLIDVQQPLSAVQQTGVEQAIRKTLVIQPVEAALMAQYGVRLSEDEIRSLVQAYHTYSEEAPLAAGAGPLPVHVEFGEHPRAANRARLYLVGPSRNAPAQFIQEVLNQSKIAGVVTFAERFQYGSQTPAVTLAVAEVEMSPEDLSRSGIREALVQSFQVFSAGLEGQYISWQEEVDNHDPIAAIQTAIRDSTFLRAIRDVNVTTAPDRWRAAERLRVLRPAEIEQLQRQGNWAEDWSRVRIASTMTADNLELIRKNEFHGDIEIGHIDAGTVTLPDKAKKSRGIVGSELRNVRLGSNVAIHQADITNYVIKQNAVVVGTRLVADPETTFGLQQAYEIENEAGRRELLVYPELTLQGAENLAARLLSDKKLAADYQEQHDRYVRLAKSKWGIVEEDAVVDRVAGDIVNTYIGRGAVIEQAQHIKETVILTGFTPVELKELQDLASGAVTRPTLLPGLALRTLEVAPKVKKNALKALRENPEVAMALLLKDQRPVIKSAAQIQFAVIKQGVHVASAAQLVKIFADEHSTFEESVNVTNMYAGPDSFFAKGEFGSVLAEAFVVSHHKGALSLGNLLRLGINIGSAGQTSNHDGYGPDQEAIIARGTFIGTGVIFVYPINLDKSPHSLLQTQIKLSPRQKVTFPAMLMGKPDPGVLSQIGARYRDYNEVVPGWVLDRMPYLLFRNQDKWQARQNALRYQFDFNILQPDIVDWMREARANLNVVSPGQEQDYYIGEQGNQQRPIGIQGLGNNYLQEKNRKQGIEIYTRFIRYYALQALYRQLDRLLEAGQLTAANVNALITQPSDDRRWEHARRTLIQELAGQPLSSILDNAADQSGLVQIQQRILNDTIQDLDNRTTAFNELMGPGGAGVMVPAEANKFVRDVLRPDTERLTARVGEIVPALTAAGANIEVPVISAGLEGEPVLDTPAPTVIGLPPVTSGTAVDIAEQRAPTGFDWIIRRGSLPEARSQLGSVGVVASNAADRRGLALGLALMRAVTADGQPVPVAFVVETANQKATLIEMGVTSTSIFQAGLEGEYPSVEDANRAANQWLTIAYGVGQVVELGVTQRILQTLQQILANIFKVVLTPESLAVWERFVGDATLALQA